VPLEEIRPGGPPRDGIPPIDRPTFVSVGSARRWLSDREPVVMLAGQQVARAYPLQVLIWHEIVNDTVRGVPVAVTFCPLCNLAVAFDRRVDGVVYDFGTSGMLRNSDLVMWDRQTESWWQQATGEAIVGAMTGKRLTPIPAAIVSFGEFRRAYANGEVLSRETGFDRPYGRNPYVGYDDINSSPFLFDGRLDPRLRPMERVVAVEHAGQITVFPFREVEQRLVIQAEVGDLPVVVFFALDSVSPLDQAEIAGSRMIGTVGVFEPWHDGRRLHFARVGDTIVDRETGSTWSVLGHATAGALSGARLRPVVHGTHFWFAVAAFYPHAQVWPGS
jgi:hypothetical protein